jgi:D-alanyl-D-alanine carboxypeptidase (penicillin-binding protein 5/6)
MTPGSSSKLKTGEKLPVKELLYGMLLPSGNDAAVALAEHFGPRFPARADPDPVARFVAAMNQKAKSLGLKETSFADPNGLSKDDLASARDLAALTWHARKLEAFRTYTGTRRHTARVTGLDGERSVTWETTNKLLEIDGYDGVKTGTTTPAGQCLVASGARGDDQLIVVILGSTSTDGRYVDARNLFRWAWQQWAAKGTK